ncbi:hypothetical protein LOD99_3894 [Oopsacas minuta]|uniref:Uncharacterized protein n=1 Tax=Oopsacas minuta TaxID=111878 RepID=A0AAV7JVT0_9METZ|nr:hypothetical protein LOD99_3894 [Oopsacas minuta]
MLLSSEALNILHDKDQLEQALVTRQVSEYGHIMHTPPPPSPMSLSTLSLQEPTDVIDIAAIATLTDTALPHPCSPHVINTYPSFTRSQELEDTPPDDTETEQTHPLSHIGPLRPQSPPRIAEPCPAPRRLFGLQLSSL